MTAVLTQAMQTALKDEARASGFDLCGIAAVPEPGSQAERLQHARFVEWAKAGHAGEMG